MDSRERTIIEVILAVIFVAIIILGSIIVIGASNRAGTDVKITDSYNTYNIYANNIPMHYSGELIGRDYINGKQYIYPVTQQYLDYDSWSRLRIGTGMFGNNINNYEVYVDNLDEAGGYFKVVYYFEDPYGNVASDSMIHYISPRDENMFVYKDVSPNQYKYQRWWYTVESLTKRP